MSDEMDDGLVYDLSRNHSPNVSSVRGRSRETK